MGVLDGKVALVTGAAGGIGRATARALAREGASLFLVDQAGCADVVEGAHVRVESAVCDVRDSAQVRAVVAAAEAAYGRIDVLVTVAGIVAKGAAETLPEELWDRTIAINLKGTWLFCQAVIPIMRRQRGGRIVTVGSLIGKNGGNPRPWIDRSELDNASNVAYGASKAGVHALTWHLAKELAADGVTVNSVAPGPIATGMTTTLPDSLRQLIPVGRMGTTEDVAEAILFLARPDSGFITGEILDVNGGMLVD